MSKKERDTKIIAKVIQADHIILAGTEVTALGIEGLTASPAELNLLDDQLGDVDFTIGAETGGNTRNIGIQLNKADGTTPMAASTRLFGYLSDDADGSSIVASAPSGGIAIGTDGLLIPVVTNKAFHLVSESDGDIDVNIVEAGAKTLYLALAYPNGKLAISSAITFAG